MNDFFKFIILTSLFTLSILTLSWPNKNIVDIRNSSFSPQVLTIESAVNEQTELIESVMLLIVMNTEGDFLSSGTGFSVKYDEKNDTTYVLTNYHVCLPVINSDKYMVSKRSFDGNIILDPSVENPEHHLSYLFSEAENDLCLLSLDGKVSPVKFAKNKPKQMDKLMVIGAPSGVFPIITETYLAGTTKRDLTVDDVSKDGNYLILSDVFFGGTSGAPVFDKSDKVVGILFSVIRRPSSDGKEYLTKGGLAIPTEDIMEFLKYKL